MSRTNIGRHSASRALAPRRFPANVRLFETGHPAVGLVSAFDALPGLYSPRFEAEATEQRTAIEGLQDEHRNGVVGDSVLRLACHGWVDEQAGSVASAGYAVLEDLLRRGVQIDLFAHRYHVPRPAALEEAGLKYFGFVQPSWLNRFDALPRSLILPTRKALAPFVAGSWRRIFTEAAEAEHRIRPYDAVLSLGTTPAFAIDGVPTVTWLQSPFHTELDAIRRLRRQITAVSGPLFYGLAIANYRYQALADKLSMIPSERLIVGSSWSREEMIAAGYSPATVEALPYPIDLHAFRADHTFQPDLEAPVLLSLGRLDPRKRLDLLLDAFGAVRRQIPAARLLIVGRPGYAPRQLSMLERSPHRDAVEYRPAVPRAEVPSLLRNAAVLVQASESENFGSAVAEALACGTPVVVGPTNGTADYVDHASQVFETYDPGSVAGAVVRAIELRRTHPGKVRESTRAAAERAFSVSTIVTRLLEIIAAAQRR